MPVLQSVSIHYCLIYPTARLVRGPKDNGKSRGPNRTAQAITEFWVLCRLYGQGTCSGGDDHQPLPLQHTAGAPGNLRAIHRQHVLAPKPHGRFCPMDDIPILQIRLPEMGGRPGLGLEFQKQPGWRESEPLSHEIQGKAPTARCFPPAGRLFCFASAIKVKVKGSVALRSPQSVSNLILYALSSKATGASLPSTYKPNLNLPFWLVHAGKC